MKKIILLISASLLLANCTVGSMSQGIKSGATNTKEFVKKHKKAIIITTVVIAAAVACEKTDCLDGLGEGGAPSESYEWDQFSNGQYRCRSTATGQFVKSHLCPGPKNDNTWPND